MRALPYVGLPITGGCEPPHHHGSCVSESPSTARAWRTPFGCKFKGGEVSSRSYIYKFYRKNRPIDSIIFSTLNSIFDIGPLHPNKPSGLPGEDCVVLSMEDPYIHDDMRGNYRYPICEIQQVS